MGMPQGLSAAEMHARDMRELREREERAVALMPQAWRDRIDADQRRHDSNVLALQKHMDKMFEAHRSALLERGAAINNLASRVIQLEKDLAAERQARERLEAIPRQTINLTLPEHETTVKLDAPSPTVNVSVPPRRMQTEVVRDKSGRIERTTSTELPA